MSVQMFQPLILLYRRDNFVDVHQYIDHCLIPLDSWFIRLLRIWEGDVNRRENRKEREDEKNLF